MALSLQVQRVLLSCDVGQFLSPKSAQKALKKHSVGHSERGIKGTQKALRGALSGGAPGHSLNVALVLLETAKIQVGQK